MFSRIRGASTSKRRTTRQGKNKRTRRTHWQRVFASEPHQKHVPSHAYAKNERRTRSPRIPAATRRIVLRRFVSSTMWSKIYGKMYGDGTFNSRQILLPDRPSVEDHRKERTETSRWAGVISTLWQLANTGRRPVRIWRLKAKSRLQRRNVWR